MTVTQLAAPHPAEFDLTAWRQHAATLLQTWLVEDFTWDGKPLSAFIAAVTATFDDDRTMPLWSARPALPPAPRQYRQPMEPGALADAEWNPWHPTWCDLLAAPWALKGRWLHPETCYGIDQVVFARNGGNLLIACADRSEPDAERRMDPTRSPYSTDQGVIAAPMFPHRALRYLEAGHTPDDAMLLLAGTALTEFAVHEALETFQQIPGQPVWDPHHTQHSLTIDVYWHTPGAVTQGWPIR